MLLTIIMVFKILSFASLSIAPDMRDVRLDRVDGICRGKSVIMNGIYTIMGRNKRYFYLNSTVRVFQDFNCNPTMQMIIKRCRSKENLDTCEEIIKPRPISYCNLIDPRNELSPLSVKHTPELKCPIKKGTYNAGNHTFDTAPFLVFPLGDWYWRFTAEINNPKTSKLLFCLKIDWYKQKPHH